MDPETNEKMIYFAVTPGNIDDFSTNEAAEAFRPSTIIYAGSWSGRHPRYWSHVPQRARETLPAAWFDVRSQGREEGEATYLNRQLRLRLRTLIYRLKRRYDDTVEVKGKMAPQWLFPEKRISEPALALAQLQDNPVSELNFAEGIGRGCPQEVMEDQEWVLSEIDSDEEAFLKELAGETT
jgi:hypothetical protein